MYIYIYITCMCMSIHIYVYVYVYIFIYLCIFKIYIHMRMYIYVYICTCIYTIYIHICIYTSVHISTHTYIYIYIYICICIYMLIYTYNGRVSHAKAPDSLKCQTSAGQNKKAAWVVFRKSLVYVCVVCRVVSGNAMREWSYQSGMESIYGAKAGQPARHLWNDLGFDSYPVGPRSTKDELGRLEDVGRDPWKGALSHICTYPCVYIHMYICRYIYMSM